MRWFRGGTPYCSSTRRIKTIMTISNRRRLFLTISLLVIFAISVTGCFNTKPLYGAEPALDAETTTKIKKIVHEANEEFHQELWRRFLEESTSSKTSR